MPPVEGRWACPQRAEERWNAHDEVNSRLCLYGKGEPGPREGWQGGLSARMCLEERNVRAEWEGGNWYPREVVLTATWARLTSRSGFQKHQCGHSRTEVVLRYFDLQARNYVPVLIPLSSPLPKPPTSLPKSNMESFYQASFFFFFLEGWGVVGGGAAQHAGS